MHYCVSTEMIDLHTQAPNRNQRECKFYWDEAYTLICGAGFTDMEIPYEPKWDFGGRSGIPRTLRSINIKFQSVENYMKVLKDAGINGISSVHLDPSMFCSGAMEMYFGAMEHFASEAIDFCAQAGSKVFCLTVTPPQAAVKALCQGDDMDGFIAAFLEKNGEVIARLAKKAADSNIKLCLKNEFWSLLRGNAIVDYVKSIKSDTPIYIDADTANLQIAGVNPAQFITDNASLVGAVHFSDTAFVDDAEIYATPSPEFPVNKATQIFKDLGQGSVDFPKIYKALQDCGYDGVVVINAKQTRDFSRGLLRAGYYMKHCLGISMSDAQ